MEGKKWWNWEGSRKAMKREFIAKNICTVAGSTNTAGVFAA